MRVPETVKDLERDLVEMFGQRLMSLVVYEPPIDADSAPTPTMAVVEGLAARDLQACSVHVGRWQELGLATPLFLAAHEFPRSLDVFPLEFGAILADHVLIYGADPFEGLHVDRRHLRHACEVQARSHLLHLREGYVETGGRGARVADLVGRSAEPLAALLKSVARLQGSDTRSVDAVAADLERKLSLPPTLSVVVTIGHSSPLTPERARLLMPAYLDAVEQLVADIDRWSGM
jgi:hypothetical protein